LQKEIKLVKTYSAKDYVEANLPEYDVRVCFRAYAARWSPSCFDRVLASRLGVKAVESLLEGKSNYMVGLRNDTILTNTIRTSYKRKTEIDRELLRVSDIMSTYKNEVYCEEIRL
jgi:6-phosphofructokinase 1